MKQNLVILFLFFSYLSFSQTDKLQAHWILEKIQYKNGHPLEVNHPLFSNFIKYSFKGNNLKINNQTLKVLIDSVSINTPYRKINYKFVEDYLITTEEGDDKEYFFLSIADYLKKYPEFEPKEIKYENRLVFEENPIIKPEFNFPEDFDSFLSKNIPSYSSTSATNNFFKAQYIFSKDNKITDIKIIEGISKSFDTQFIKALQKSGEYLTNPTGKDLLATQKFNFFKLFNGLTNQEEKKLYEFILKGDKAYQNNDFLNAILNYNKLNEISLDSQAKDRFGYHLDKAYINLGISYLVTADKRKACEAFKNVGDKTNFKVRNYVISFCQ